MACHCPFCSTCLCSTQPTVTSFTLGPFWVLYSSSVCFNWQQCWALKNGLFLFEHRCRSAPNHSSALIASLSASYFLNWRQHWRGNLVLWNNKLSHHLQNKSALLEMLTLDCSLQQLTPHGLTVCCWEHGSSSWLSGRQKQHHAHSHRRDVEASKPQ